MPNYTYINNIPAASNSPSADQPNMKTNTQSINSILSVDLYGFNNTNGGTHQQVTFPLNVTPSAPTTVASVLFTQPGVADSSHSQLQYQNAVFTSVLSSFRAWAFCNAAGISGSQSMNVTSVTNTGAGQYNVVLATNAVNSSSFAVLVSCTMQNNFTSGNIPGYVITGTGTFQLNFRGLSGAFGSNPTSFSFLVLQI